ncbi:MAG TPA: sulfite exporter TauE/SafE family protein [Saprospiraceae bacterium]|nr:sulfite exporter TauE/SafE family protein [Saprospiraceae bacterium]HMQ85169.1 sulfite exporter TauE/SafE family protein [Saprospiraceae bacterium]
MSKYSVPYLIFLGLVIVGWLVFMISTQAFHLYQYHWPAALTMVFGAFIAGASSEGGGAVAFPVFTLLLGIAPAVARNFSFAIQSIGMTAASLLILGLGYKVEKKAILWASIGGVGGILLTTFAWPNIFTPAEIKLFFVSLWLSFGFALYAINTNKSRIVYDEIQHFSGADALKLIFFGFLGGGVSGLIGNGIDILTFCLLTLNYRISEKVATPTSVILMTISTLQGLFLHWAIVGDFHVGSEAFNYWVVAAPVVVICAPLGAWVINKFPRNAIASFLYFIIVLQFITAYYVLGKKGQLDLKHILFSLSVFLLGLMLFWIIARVRKKNISLAS